MSSPRRLAVLALPVAAALMSLGVACGGDSPNEVSIGASEFAFDVDAADFTPGTNEITLRNDGAQVHHMQMVRLIGDATLEDVLAGFEAVEQGAPFPESAIPDGGVGQLDPGATGSVIVSLTAGRYVLICGIPDEADGVPHFAKGMAATIEVTGDENEAELPDADFDVRAIDYGFEGAPSAVDAGALVLQLENAGQELHEANLMRLDEGVTVEALLAAFTSEAPPAGPPPFAMAGGAQAILPGGSTVVEAELEAGNYALICFIPNAEGIPHFALGMIAPFTVE